MVIRFKNSETRRICNEETYARKKLCAEGAVIRKLQMLMERLNAVPQFIGFLNTPLMGQYNVHELHGKKKGTYSLSINFQYRMELIVEVKSETDEICILEVSNHYGD